MIGDYSRLTVPNFREDRTRLGLQRTRSLFAMFRSIVVCVAAPVSQVTDVVRTVTRHGGKRTFSVAPTTTHLVCAPNIVAAGDRRLDRAMAMGIPLVSLSYFKDCVAASRVLELKVGAWQRRKRLVFGLHRCLFSRVAT